MITLYAQDSDHRGQRDTQLLRYDKGMAIYFEGDPVRHWFEVVSGIVRTCRFHADGHRQLTGFFYAEDVFGVERDRHSETAEAVTDVLLRRHVIAEIEAPPREGGDGARTGRVDGQERVLQRALSSARQCIFLLGHRTAVDRIAAFLLAARRGRLDRIDLAMTRSDIADHLGLTMHTVSRTFSELVRRRIIALDDAQHVRLLDIDRLRALAGEQDRERAPTLSGPPIAPAAPAPRAAHSRPDTSRAFAWRDEPVAERM